MRKFAEAKGFGDHAKFRVTEESDGTSVSYTLRTQWDYAGAVTIKINESEMLRFYEGLTKLLAKSEEKEPVVA